MHLVRPVRGAPSRRRKSHRVRVEFVPSMCSCRNGCVHVRDCTRGVDEVWSLARGQYGRAARAQTCMKVQPVDLHERGEYSRESARFRRCVRWTSVASASACSNVGSGASLSICAMRHSGRTCFVPGMRVTRQPVDSQAASTTSVTGIRIAICATGVLCAIADL